MTTASPLGTGELGAPPAAIWVRFLRSYGPTPQNLTMFDEYVSGAVGRAKVQPIQLATPLLEDMVKRIESKAPGSMLIAGTAGDGKTYHCRALWARLGGDPKAWSAKGNVKELRLADGRLAVFIKDLSEFNGQESDLPLQRLERSVLGGDDSEVLVVAANHGQVLDRLRDMGKRQGRRHPLRTPLQECFLQAGPAPERLAVFDLSRTTTRKTFEEVAKAVAGHQEWENCSRCALRADGKICLGLWDTCPRQRQCDERRRPEGRCRTSLEGGNRGEGHCGRFGARMPMAIADCPGGPCCTDRGGWLVASR